jgi:hypothetical protein
MKRLPAHEAQGAKRHCVEGAEGTCARGDSHRGDSAATASAGGDSVAAASAGCDSAATASVAAATVRGLQQLHAEIADFAREVASTGREIRCV